MNKVNNQDMDSVYKMLKEAELEILGSVPLDDKLETGTTDWKSDLVKDAVKQFYFRLNLPQENS